MKQLVWASLVTLWAVAPAGIAPGSAHASEAERVAGGSLVSLLSVGSETRSRSLARDVRREGRPHPGERSVTFRVRGTELEAVSPNGIVVLRSLPESTASEYDHFAPPLGSMARGEDLIPYLRAQLRY